MEKSLKAQDPDKKQKLVKYLLFALIIGIFLRYVPSNKITDREIMIIGALSSITFGIMDMVAPSIKLNV